MTPALACEELFLPLANAMAAFRSEAYCIPRAQIRMRFSMQRKQGRRVLFWAQPGNAAGNIQELNYEVIAHPSPQPVEFARIVMNLPAFLLPPQLELQRSIQAFSETQSAICFSLGPSAGFFAAQYNPDPALDAHCMLSPDGKITRFAKAPQGWDYTPFRSLFDTLRSNHASIQYPYPANSDPAWAWDGFNTFLQNLWLAYRAAAIQLCPQAFALNGFQARFLYCSEERWTQSELCVSFHPVDSTLQLDLLRPEFVLSGDARGTLLNLLLQPLLIEQLIADCAWHSALPALDPQCFFSRPAEALFLLSYEDEPSDSGFLAIWPTPQGDYLFTCNSNGSRLTAEPKVFAFCPPGPIWLSESAYRPLHNFLRAYLLWRGKSVNE